MRHLGLDLGTKTLGIAISDINEIIASPLTTLKFVSMNDKVIDELKDIVLNRNVEKIVLGLPKNMNNTIGPRAEATIEFKKILENKLNIKIDLMDERLTTKEAESILINADMSRKKRKKVIDQMAAVIILQNYLNRRSNQNGKNWRRKECFYCYRR